MERVLILKGIRGADVIGHDCYEISPHPLLMHDNRFLQIPPYFHKVVEALNYHPVCLYVKGREGWRGTATAVFTETCSPHNVLAPAPNTATHSLSHKHTHIGNLKSSDPPIQT